MDPMGESSPKKHAPEKTPPKPGTWEDDFPILAW